MDMLKIDWPVSLRLPGGNSKMFPTAHCPYPLSFFKEVHHRDQGIGHAALIAKYGLPGSYVSVLKINRILVKTKTMMIKEICVPV